MVATRQLASGLGDACLNGKLEQSRAQIRRLSLGNEILAAMIATPPVEATMLAPK
jgi:hypothetical protein